ncbi:MAG: class I SAM-dependent methyltransferase [Bacteroidota bacterium]
MSSQEKDILQYYNELAPDYDDNRFGNSYGQFIHQQEWKLLERWCPPSNDTVLDLGCGTGRLLKFATHGLDLSPEMITMASEKHPEKILRVGSAFETGFEEAQFDSIYCFHVLMHLDESQSRSLFAEAKRIIKRGGQLVIDFPSLKRRQLLGYQNRGWHGANAFSLDSFRQLLGNDWTLQSYTGLMALPVHRLPKILRAPMRPIDSLLCQSPWREYASYLAVLLQKS